MNDNPYAAPRQDDESSATKGEHSGDRRPNCPECGETMESGFIASSASLFWRHWSNRKWLLRGNESLSKTSSVFGINKLSGFRCVDCEVVTFAYGDARNRFSPADKPD